jgi:hypothetical protein
MLGRRLTQFPARLCLDAFLIATMCLTGCGKPAKPLPTTYPVHGKVTYKDGAPVRDGLVQFHPEADPSVTTVAVIQSDGTYRLKSMRDGVRAEGAVPGVNRVMVTPPGNAHGIILPVTYPTPYNVEPRDNEFHLTIERPRH